MSAVRKALLMTIAQRAKVSVDQADAAAAQLLHLLLAEVYDGAAIVIRHKKATSKGLLVSEGTLNLDKLIQGALDLEAEAAQS